MHVFKLTRSSLHKGGVAEEECLYAHFVVREGCWAQVAMMLTLDSWKASTGTDTDIETCLLQCLNSDFEVNKWVIFGQFSVIPTCRHYYNICIAKQCSNHTFSATETRICYKYHYKAFFTFEPEAAATPYISCNKEEQRTKLSVWKVTLRGFLIIDSKIGDQHCETGQSIDGPTHQSQSPFAHGNIHSDKTIGGMRRI